MARRDGVNWPRPAEKESDMSGVIFAPTYEARRKFTERHGMTSCIVSTDTGEVYEGVNDDKHEQFEAFCKLAERGENAARYIWADQRYYLMRAQLLAYAEKGSAKGISEAMSQVENVSHIAANQIYSEVSVDDDVPLSDLRKTAIRSALNDVPHHRRYGLTDSDVRKRRMELEVAG